jgi:putative transposase
MPRLRRIIFTGVPHHVTQRGNRREQVFFSDADRHSYLRWLRDYTDHHGVEVLAYCLMSNHVHLVLVPSTKTALEDALRPLHTRYAQHVNRIRGWHGHVWQGRYYSSALDDLHAYAAVRYVERNPVRARIVDVAERYRWSSAGAHCGHRADPVFNADTPWQLRLRSIGDWSRWLGSGDESHTLELLRRNSMKGLPCGSSEFLEGIERDTGRTVRYRAQGRPKKPRS